MAVDPEHPAKPAPDPGHARPGPGDAVTEAHRSAPSPHAVAANAAVLALTRAAHSFTLYDPSNKVVRQLIADYRDKLEKALAGFGALALEVHAFELLLGNEVVYLEKDRERSLAFRLFRDGVRRIAFQPGATWEELLRLLQVLSIRFTGVRQQEDDLVTALRKADFDHLEVTAIDGFVPQEEHAEESPASATRGTAERYEAPAHWDLPLPAFQEMVPLRYRIVPAELLERLRAEESPESVVRAAPRAVAELLQSGPQDLPAVLGFALEVREFLLVERRLDLLGELGRMVCHALSANPDSRAAFLGSYLDAHALEALIEALPADAEVPAALLELVDVAPGETREALLAILAEADAGPRAITARALAARAFRGASDTLASRLRQASGRSAAALLQLLAQIDPANAMRHALDAARSTDTTLQAEAARQLALLPASGESARTLQHLADAPFEEVRIAAIPALARGGARSFPQLSALAEKRAASLGTPEAEALGRALVESDATSALGLFEGWLRPRSGGLLGRSRMHASPPLQKAALAGLRLLGSRESHALLQLLATQGDPAVAQEAAAALRGREGLRV